MYLPHRGSSGLELVFIIRRIPFEGSFRVQQDVIDGVWHVHVEVGGGLKESEYVRKLYAVLEVIKRVESNIWFTSSYRGPVGATTFSGDLC